MDTTWSYCINIPVPCSWGKDAWEKEKSSFRGRPDGESVVKSEDCGEVVVHRNDG